MPKNILLLGGAFDPPTIAHVTLATLALEIKQNRTFDPCELWFMPTNSNAFNMVSKPTPAEHRLNMLNILVNDIIGLPSIRVSSYEIEQGNKAGPYAVVKSLIASYPGVSFTYVMGSDQANDIRAWRKSRDLVKTIPFIVIDRAGTWNHRGIYWYMDAPHIHHKKAITANRVSSSQVRSDLLGTENRAHFAYEHHPMLKASTQNYIYANDLYRG